MASFSLHESRARKERNLPARLGGVAFRDVNDGLRVKKREPLELSLLGGADSSEVAAVLRTKRSIVHTASEI